MVFVHENKQIWLMYGEIRYSKLCKGRKGKVWKPDIHLDRLNRVFIKVDGIVSSKIIHRCIGETIKRVMKTVWVKFDKFNT